MAKLVECIPNFSEGRNKEVIEALAQEAKRVPGVMLLDYSADASHNRSVFTLLGDSEQIGEAAFRLVKLAAEKIDMTKHRGEHPRMGAADVVPFVPIQNVSVEECIEISIKVGQRINQELGIPVFLYEDSAASPERVNLAKIRKGQFEGMAEKLLQKEWQPDFGERKIHPTAGVTAVGARMPLIAFNVNLSTSDVEIAGKIAKRVRAISGGFKYCKAMGVKIEERDIAQVSMNMVNYEGTSLYTVFEAVKTEAKRYGVYVTGSEIVGLAPAKALIDCAEFYLQIENWDYKTQVIENHIIS